MKGPAGVRTAEAEENEGSRKDECMGGSGVQNTLASIRPAETGRGGGKDGQ